MLKRKGKRVYLLTNVSDLTHLSRSVASDLYAARWGIEVSYRSLEQTLGRRKVLARTPQAGAMELAGNILALALLRLQAALAQGSKVVRLSVSRALGLVRRVLEALRFGRSSHRFVTDLRGALRDRYRRGRPKKGPETGHTRRKTPYRLHRFCTDRRREKRP